MITEEEVEKAVHWLTANAVKAAQAKANRIYLQEYRKTLKAKLMKESSDLPLAAQEREAYADARYVEHLEALKTAVMDDEKFSWLMVAAETKVSAWQTQAKFQRTGV